MNNRLSGKNHNSRIDRTNKSIYEEKARAYRKTLRFYFSEDWFDTDELNRIYQQNKIHLSSYPIYRCSDCDRPWSHYLTYYRQLEMQYYDHLTNMPFYKKICPGCS